MVQGVMMYRPQKTVQQQQYLSKTTTASANLENNCLEENFQRRLFPTGIACSSSNKNAAKQVSSCCDKPILAAVVAKHNKDVCSNNTKTTTTNFKRQRVAACHTSSLRPVWRNLSSISHGCCCISLDLSQSFVLLVFMLLLCGNNVISQQRNINVGNNNNNNIANSNNVLPTISTPSNLNDTFSDIKDNGRQGSSNSNNTHNDTGGNEASAAAADGLFVVLIKNAGNKNSTAATESMAAATSSNSSASSSLTNNAPTSIKVSNNLKDKLIANISNNIDNNKNNTSSSSSSNSANGESVDSNSNKNKQELDNSEELLSESEGKFYYLHYSFSIVILKKRVHLRNLCERLGYHGRLFTHKR